jgi:diguanylate cyclase (GGDEF)-like protein/PAS domain S-box-containing protein
VGAVMLPPAHEISHPLGVTAAMRKSGREGGLSQQSIPMLFAVFALFACGVLADGLSLDQTERRPSLAGHLSILIDESGEMTLPDALEQDRAGRFRPIPGDEVAPGFLPTGAVWIHVALDRLGAAPAHWWLVILHEPLDVLDLYILGPDGRWSERHGGRALPFTQREAFWNGHAFALDLEPPGQYEVYLRASTIGVLRVPLWLLLPGDFDRLRVEESFVFAATFGIAGIALLLGLFRALRYRSAVDACYATYLLGLLTGIFVLYGYFQEFGFSDNLPLRVTLGWVGYLLGALALLWLVILFVVWPAVSGRRLRRAAGVLTTAILVTTVLVLWLEPRSIVHWTMLVVLFLPGAALVLSAYAAMRRWPGGLAFLLAFTPFVATVMLYQSGSFGWAHAGFLLSRSLIYLGILIHSLILLGMILNRDATLRQERDRELAAERALLEQRVADRTRSLAQALAFNETVLVNSPVPTAVFAANGPCILANDALAELIGTTREILMEADFNRIATWRQSGLLDACRATLADRRPRQIEINGATSFGKEVWLEARITPRMLNGTEHLLIQFIDLTARKRLEDDLLKIAFHDPLTKLPNRRLLRDRLEQAALRARRLGNHGAVLFIDLDRFKELNDTHGHAVGDLLLIQLAERLREHLRQSDTAARLGGDEFVVLLEGLGADPDQAVEYAAAVAAKIRVDLSREYRLGDIAYRGSASVGFTLFPAASDDPEQILKEADRAMYAAKRLAASNLARGAA